MGQDAGPADQALTVPAGRNALPDLWRFHALFPSPQGILGGSHAKDEGVWLEHPHNVSTLALIPRMCTALMVAMSVGTCGK